MLLNLQGKHSSFLEICSKQQLKPHKICLQLQIALIPCDNLIHSEINDLDQQYLHSNYLTKCAREQQKR